MKPKERIKELIGSGEVDAAIELADRLIQDPSTETERDTYHYLRGNAYRKKGDWKEALNSYARAIELNPQSPATEARKMAMDILEFFHKDMYNQ